MKIVLFYIDNNDIVIRQISRQVIAYDFEIVLFKITPAWKDDKVFFNKLSEARHIIFLTGEKQLSEDCFLFLSGYCLGSGRGLILLDEKKIFGNIGSAASITTVKEIKHQLEIWSSQAGREQACISIQEQGLYMTPYHFIQSVVKDHQDIVKTYLEAGFSPDTRDDNDVPALCLALRDNLNMMARQLIDAGCDINAVASDRNYNALMEAAVLGNTEMVRLLLDKGAELNLQSKNDQTALMLAVGIGNEEIVRILCEAGADVNIKDVLDMTALQYARILKHDAITECLLNISKKRT